MMTKEEFETKWSIVERRSDSIFWSFYISASFAAVLVFLCAAGILCASFFLNHLKISDHRVTGTTVIWAVASGSLIMAVVAFIFARITGEKFPLRRDSAERHGHKARWNIYTSVQLCVFTSMVLVAAFWFWCTSPLLSALNDLLPEYRGEVRGLAFRVGGASALLFGALEFTDWSFRRWLKKLGMQCRACGHILHCHTGAYLTPHIPGRCTNCEGNGKCRKVRTTGLCDNCGHRVFDA